MRSLGELRNIGGLVFNQVSPGSFRRYYYYDAYSRYAYGEPGETQRFRGGCLRRRGAPRYPRGPSRRR